MTVDPKVEARILRELDRLTKKRDAELERRKAADKAIADQAVDLIVEGARAGMRRGQFVDRPYSNRWLTKLYQDHGLAQRPRKAATSGRRSTEKGTEK